MTDGLNSVTQELLAVRKMDGQTSFDFLFSFSLQEGANINKSLTTLGKVISALAEVVCFHFCTCCDIQVTFKWENEFVVN